MVEYCCCTLRPLSALKFPAPAEPSAPPRVPRHASWGSSPRVPGCRLLAKTRDFNSVARVNLWSLHASSADFGADKIVEESSSSKQTEFEEEESTHAKLSDLVKQKKTLQQAAVIGTLIAIGTLVAIVTTLANRGPGALLAAISKSGFTAAFSLIFISEIGDKTFFIAALLAMQHPKSLVLLGSVGALSVMTVISVIIGRVFYSIPAQLKTTLPIGEYAAVLLLVFFGYKSIKNAWDLPSSPAKDQGSESVEIGELAEAEEFLKNAEVKTAGSPLTIIAETFSLVFVAEWGDRSMLATIALGAAQSPWGVAIGASVGHLAATALAVVGGAFLARYISEKTVGYIGGFLFFGFAAATLMGVF